MIYVCKIDFTYPQSVVKRTESSFGNTIYVNWFAFALVNMSNVR